MTTSFAKGFAILTIPKGTILTSTGFAPLTDSTLHFPGSLLLAESRIGEVLTPATHRGLLKDEWLWNFRAALRDGFSFYRGGIKNELAKCIVEWYPAWTPPKA